MENYLDCSCKKCGIDLEKVVLGQKFSHRTLIKPGDTFGCHNQRTAAGI